MTRKKNVKIKKERFDINRARKMYNKRLKIARDRERENILRSSKSRSKIA